MQKMHGVVLLCVRNFLFSTRVMLSSLGIPVPNYIGHGLYVIYQKYSAAAKFAAAAKQ